MTTEEVILKILENNAINSKERRSLGWKYVIIICVTIISFFTSFTLLAINTIGRLDNIGLTSTIIDADNSTSINALNNSNSNTITNTGR